MNASTSLSLIVLLTSISFQVNAGSSRLEITRGQETKTRVSYDFWSGEYPGPVIDINSKITGTTTIEGFSSILNLKEKVKCTIKNGLYHPWSRAENSVENFSTLIATSRYRALETVDIGDTTKIKKGSLVADVRYHGEGTCGANLVTSGKKSEIAFDCDILDDQDAFRILEKSEEFTEQGIILKCAENYKAYVQDAILLAQPGIKEGTIVDYGTVGPAEEN